MTFKSFLKKQAKKGFTAYKIHNKPENKIKRARDSAELAKFQAQKRKFEMQGRPKSKKTKGDNGLDNALGGLF